MSRVSQADIEQAFSLLARSASRAGADTDDWTLVAGSDEERERRPWLVSDGSAHPVLHLGYTRREALSAMSAMLQVLKAIA